MPDSSTVSYSTNLLVSEELINVFALLEAFHCLLTQPPWCWWWHSDYCYYKQNFWVCLSFLCGSYTTCFQVADLLGKYPDLMEGFNEFLERCERIGSR